MFFCLLDSCPVCLIFKWAGAGFGKQRERVEKRRIDGFSQSKKNTRPQIPAAARPPPPLIPLLLHGPAHVCRQGRRPGCVRRVSASRGGEQSDESPHPPPTLPPSTLQASASAAALVWAGVLAASPSTLPAWAWAAGAAWGCWRSGGAPAFRSRGRSISPRRPRSRPARLCWRKWGAK